MSEQEIRIKLFDWLHEQELLNGGVFPRKQLESEFTINGKIITLIGPSGIWIPAGFSTPISITTIISGPYDDGLTENGVLNYKYRGTDNNHRDNIGLREAMRQQIPLVYFQSIKPGKYVAVWPVFVIEDVPSELCVRVAIDAIYSITGEINVPTFLAERNNEAKLGVRKYITVLTKKRLHQVAFREFVLDAYGHKCTLCNLQHIELLDAAHIIADSELQGEPIVSNGLALCKIHHAAYDSDVIGISPDYLVKVRKDILDEIDGPMLKYGLQAMEGNKIRFPNNKSDYPDRDKLDIRYNRFLSA
jgi:putative restriction endonuclease